MTTFLAGKSVQFFHKLKMWHYRQLFYHHKHDKDLLLIQNRPVDRQTDFDHREINMAKASKPFYTNVTYSCY